MAEKTLIPRYYELEQFRQAAARKLWVAVALLGAVAVLCIILAVLTILKPTPVIAFDARGRPILFEDTISPRLRIDEMRVQYVAREFLDKFVGIDSAALDRDLRDALNLMTPRLQRVVKNDKDALTRRSSYQNANVRSHFESFEVRVAPYDETGAERIHLIAWGKMLFEPRSGVLDEGEQAVTQWFFSQMVLERVPISRLSIHGLLVDYAHTRFYGSEDELEVERLKRRP